MTGTKTGPHSRFFAGLRKSLYAGVIPPGAVAGHAAILAGFERMVPNGDRRQLAYVLATAFHETGGRLQPVEENLNYTAAGLRRTFPQRFTLEDAEDCARQPEAIANRAYANRMGNGDVASGDGFRFRGRGLVQITGRANYRAYGIEDHPEAAMEPERAVTILIDGMRTGRFTGKRLDDYFCGSRADWVEARRIINGMDRAVEIARIARLYVLALSEAFPAGLPARLPRVRPDIETGDGAW
ncbi:hypothetical protein [Affinirhizobium pseudoryzae]|uniref:hypothetical protein n=1 Tax=Allorhizobium pseudoryzae TaxID=379684 RepID=UPI0019D21108|nr:hypothetical protein [Allorhizobium pseudoryzae]